MTQRIDMADKTMLERLGTVVDAYGADQSRWPAAERVVLEPFIKATPEARRMLAEAGALDRVLAEGCGTAPTEQVDRVRARLLAQIDAEGATMAPGEAAVASTVVPFQRPAASRSPQPARSRHWREVALLAAALLLGVFVGTQDIIDGSRLGLPGYAISTTNSDDISELALGGASETLSVEDLL